MKRADGVILSHELMPWKKIQYRRLMRSSSRTPTEEETELHDKITRLQERIIVKIASAKKARKDYRCQHFETVPQKCEAYDKNVDYYARFWQGFLMNEICYERINYFKANLDAAALDLTEIEELNIRREELIGGKFKKKIRRTADQITKVYKCSFQKCGRSYGAKVSLNLHLKLKHSATGIEKGMEQFMSNTPSRMDKKSLETAFDLSALNERELILQDSIRFQQ